MIEGKGEETKKERGWNELMKRGKGRKKNRKEVEGVEEGGKK